MARRRQTTGERRALGTLRPVQHRWFVRVWLARMAWCVRVPEMEDSWMQVKPKVHQKDEHQANRSALSYGHVR